MKILITGSAGLLGSDVVRCFLKHADSCIRLREHAADGFLALDLMNESSFDVLSKMNWDAVVHTAAWKDPDKCEKDPASAFRINETASRHLAELAADRKAPMVFISTDYVFDGTCPPYREKDQTNPLNAYGQSKLAGEKAVLELLPEQGIVLRVPFLYGSAAGLDRCPLLKSTWNALHSEVPWRMDDRAIRYPTRTSDVAEAIYFLLQKHASGIYHFSGQTGMTRYAICALMAEKLGLGMDCIERSTQMIPQEARRPENAHLDSGKILSEGFPEPAPFEEGLTEVLRELELL